MLNSTPIYSLRQPPHTIDALYTTLTMFCFNLLFNGYSNVWRHVFFIVTGKSQRFSFTYKWSGVSLTTLMNVSYFSFQLNSFHHCFRESIPIFHSIVTLWNCWGGCLYLCFVDAGVNKHSQGKVIVILLMIISKMRETGQTRNTVASLIEHRAMLI